MEEREFSSPVCYLDFDRVPATPPKPGVQQASSAGETGSLVPKTAALAAPGSPKDAPAASPPAAPITAPNSRSNVDSTLASQSCPPGPS
jgi:hypothetical protein